MYAAFTFGVFPNCSKTSDSSASARLGSLAHRSRYAFVSCVKLVQKDIGRNLSRTIIGCMCSRFSMLGPGGPFGTKVGVAGGSGKVCQLMSPQYQWYPPLQLTSASHIFIPSTISGTSTFPSAASSFTIRGRIISDSSMGSSSTTFSTAF